MARILVQLKLRLLGNALRASTPAKVSFIISVTCAVIVAAGTFTVLALLRGQPASVDVTTVIFTTFALGWLILPIFVFGLDGTLDPATLALYPLRTRPLAVGLLAASATGAWPLANLLGLLGVTVGLARGALGVLIAVIAVLLQVLFCITLARFVTTGMARLLRSRRGKDLAAFLVIPIFALYEFFTQVVPRVAAEGKISAASFSGVDSWLRWLPPGLAAHAIGDASDGHPGAAVARLALLAAVIVALGWLWVRSLGRALVTADTSTQSSRVRGTALPLARSGLRGTVAARVWIYQRRDPAVPRVLGHHRGDHGRRVHQHHPRPPAASRRSDLQCHPGRRLRRGLPREPGRAHRGAVRLRGAGAARPARTAVLLFRPGHRARRDRGAAGHRGLVRPGGRGPEAGGGLRGHGGGPGRHRRGAGRGQHLHRRAALSHGQAGRQPPAPVRPGIRGARLGSILGTLVCTGVAASPVIVVAVLTSADPAVVRVPLLVLGAAAYGLALAWAGVRIAARAAEGRLPELCQVAIRSQL